jgi:hypothetical protein
MKGLYGSNNPFAIASTSPILSAALQTNEINTGTWGTLPDGRAASSASSRSSRSQSPSRPRTPEPDFDLGRYAELENVLTVRNQEGLDTFGNSGALRSVLMFVLLRLN